MFLEERIGETGTQAEEVCLLAAFGVDEIPVSVIKF